MLDLINLYVNVEGKEILHGIDLHVPDGEVHALFGPNGSGKSVMIMAIMGYPEYEVTSGKIIFDNHNLADLPIDQRANLGIGVSQQRPPTIKGVKLRNIIELIVSKDQKRDYANKMIKNLKIEKFLERNINDGFSGGEIKYSELFLVLVSCPSFLLLDEPDSGVDPEHLKSIGKMINEILRKKNSQANTHNSHINRNGGLIVTHSAAILDYVHVDKAHLMVDGKILCSGNPGIMMDQIRNKGYEYCFECQKIKGG